MSTVSDTEPTVAPVVVAALLLEASRFAQQLGLPGPTGAQIFETTGASRSRAYDLRSRLARLLPNLLRPVGRPAAGEPAATTAPTETLTLAALDFVCRHPGCIHGGPQRRRYTDEYRSFVVELRRQHADLGLEEFAAALLLPPGTLCDWLVTAQAAAISSAAFGDPDARVNEPGAELSPLLPQLESILLAWRGWRGTFLDFCRHVRDHLHLSVGPTLIGNLLEACGVRRRRRRTGRSPDEVASRGSFLTFHPDAQWVGDGTAISVSFEEQRFDFNFELVVDCYSAGFVGMAVTDTEDSDAVVNAFRDAQQTTEADPIALLLDNRGSNHTEQVDQALGDTLRMRSTLGRAQSKAHVEGGFGLLAQDLPPIVLPSGSAREQARQLASLVLQAFLRGRNHRPRRDRGGRSRAQLHQDQPTPEQAAQARAALEERYRKQRLAQQTLAARQRPEIQRYLDDAFCRLGLTDPECNVRHAIARYPLSAIVDGVATFESKLRAGRIQPDEPARYLLGIVRRIAEEDDGFDLAEALIDARLLARDALLAPLRAARDAILSAQLPTDEAARQLVCRAVDTDRRLDRFLWLRAAARLIAAAPHHEQLDLMHEATLRIHTTHRVPHAERVAAFRYLADRAVPLA